MNGIILLWILLQFTLNISSKCHMKRSTRPICVRDEEYNPKNWTKSKYFNEYMCTSQGCLKAACSIIKNMDPCIDPCENFYNFACGNFIKNANIPDDKGTINVPHFIGDSLDAKLRELLESDQNNLRAFKLAKHLYKTCMDTERIEKYSVNILKTYLKKLGGWPVISTNWNEREFDWEKVSYCLHKVGFGSSFFFRLYVFLDPKNSSRTVLFLHQALLGLKREYLSKGRHNKLVQAYYNYMVDVAVLFGADRKMAKQEMRESLSFELALAKISVPKEDLRNFTKLYNPMTIKELERKYPAIPWLRYINTMVEVESIPEDEIVIVQAPSYIEGLGMLLLNTPKRVQANYVFWRVVENSVSFLSSDVRNRLLIYSRHVSGTRALPPRWKECVSVVSNGWVFRMPVAIGSLYVRTYFNTESKNQALDMVANIRTILKEILEEVEWMDQKTKKRALEKLTSMGSYVGYPDELLNDDLIEQFYSQLNMSDSYLESVLEITKFERVFEFRSLHSPVNKSTWVDHANSAVVNAFYTFSENSINLPAGILQGAFFANDRPRYMNYGAIGTVIGHEIIHGYDDKGRQYDKNGNLIDWWLPPTEKSFIKRAQCFINQYSHYKDPDVHLKLNGINTQGENMADNGGVKAAYKAYKKWTRQNGLEAKLPGLTYTPEQLFWLSFANAFCSKSRPEYSKLIITTDEHSPAMFRVIGSLSNIPEFAEDFHCKKKTKMNPIAKCVLW